MKRLILIPFLCCFCSSLSSQTNVSGGIFSNTTWTVANSPYIVIDDVVVFENVVLTIEPGVTVKFNDGKGLEIRGTLQAVGTVNDSIYFTSSSNSPFKGIWNKILFLDIQISSIQYISVSYANHGLELTVDNNNTSFQLDNSRFYENNVGIHTNSTCILNHKNCVFEFNGTAINSVQYLDLINCHFLNNQNAIEYIYDTNILNCKFIGNTGTAVVSFRATFNANTFKSNNVALDIKLFTGSIVTNNIITENSIGCRVKGEVGSPVNGFYNNCIYNNSTYNVQHTNNISINLTNNYWGITDSAQIENTIWHAVDNIALGLIDFTPFDNSCEADTAVGIKEFPINDWIVIYPNPTSGLATIMNTQQRITNVEVYDVYGRLIPANFDIGRSLIDIRHSPPGIYFVKVGEATSKLILR